MYTYSISSNKRRGVYFKLLMARKAFIRGRHLLKGGVYLFIFWCHKDELIITGIYLIKTVKPESTRLSKM